MRGREPPIEAIAYHETGHTVMALFEHTEIESVSIAPDPNSLGRLWHRPVFRGIDLACDNSLEGRARAESLVRVALAGSIAQRQFDPATFRHHHSYSDYTYAAQLLGHLAGSDEEVQAYRRLLHIQVKSMLTRVAWEVVGRVANGLLESHTLSEDEIQKLL